MDGVKPVGECLNSCSNSNLERVTDLIFREGCGKCVNGTVEIDPSKKNWNICVDGNKQQIEKCEKELEHIGDYYYCPASRTKPDIQCAQYEGVGYVVNATGEPNKYQLNLLDKCSGNGEVSCKVKNAVSTTCGVCKNGLNRCDDNAWQLCENGTWVTKRVCGFGCTDNGCVEDEGEWF